VLRYGGIDLIGYGQKVWRWPELEPDVAALHHDERAGGSFSPGAAVDVAHAIVIGDEGQVGMTTGDEVKPSTLGVFRGPALDQLAVALKALGDPPDPPGGPVGHPFLNEIEEPAGDLGKPGVVGSDRVKLIAVENQELDLAVVEDILVQDLDADDVADDLGRAIVIAANPDHAEIRAVGVAADDLQAGEVPSGKPLEVEVVEDVAVDDQHAAVFDGPDQEFLELPGLADMTSQMQVADDNAVVHRVVVEARRLGQGLHDPAPADLRGSPGSGLCPRAGPRTARTSMGTC